jgi:hypothetical protein
MPPRNLIAAASKPEQQEAQRRGEETAPDDRFQPHEQG